MYGRVFFVALGLVGALGAAAIYGVGAHLVVDGDITPGTLVALAALVARVYPPLTGLTNARVDLMTAMVSFERVFEVLDAPEAIAERPGAVDLVDPRDGSSSTTSRSATRRPSESSIASLEQQPIPGADPDRDVLEGVSPDDRRRARRSPWSARPAPARPRWPRSSRGCTTSPAGAVRVDGHDVRDLTQASLRRAIGVVGPGPAPVPRVDRRQPALRQARRHRRRARGGVPRRPASTT